MYERKENLGNKYFPSFFFTSLDIQEDIHLLCRFPLDERAEACFLHEYIHYLQDLTTPSGHARIGTIVDQVKWAVDLARKKKSIRIPLDPESTWSYNLKPNAYCMRLANGEMKKKTIEKTDVVFKSPQNLRLIEEQVPYTNGKYNREKTASSFVFEDNKSREYVYKIGEMAISESMAYIIENHIYPGVLADCPDFPYKVVRNVVKWKCPKANDDLTLVAICDVCLLYSFPGAAFYYLIDYLSSYRGDITPDLIYLYGLGYEMCEKMGVKYWCERFDKSNKETIHQLNDYFTHPYWNNTNIALKSAMVNAYAYRKNKLKFFLDIAKEGKLCQNYTFKDALSYMGCMAIQTASNQMYYFAPKGAESCEVEPSWFVSLCQLYKILFSEDAIIEQRGEKYVIWKCCLKEWCHDSFIKKELPDITTSSYNCKDYPWQNSSEYLRALCAFGRLWAVYGFSRVKIKPNNCI